MSSTTKSVPAAHSVAVSSSRTLLLDLVQSVADGVRAVAFWTTVLVPIAMVLAVASGLTTTNPTVLFGLLGVGGLSAILGHEHTPRR